MISNEAARAQARTRTWRVHLVLACSAAAGVVLEATYVERGASTWLALAGCVTAGALLYAWRNQDALRLRTILVVALCFQLAWLLTDQILGFTGDDDPNVVYLVQGKSLLHGAFPMSEYPVGAVILFALEAFVGAGDVQLANAVLMVAFQLACVVAVWSLRTRSSAWLATVIAIWPLNVWYWENRFDLVPTALMLIGLLLVLRGSWMWAGIALGGAAAVKATPALTLAVLAIWLIATRKWTEAKRLCAAFVGIVLLVNIPFLLWSPQTFWHPYELQMSRKITGESVWYFPLKALGMVESDFIVRPIGAPEWTNAVVTLIQVALISGLFALAIVGRRNDRFVICIAALAPSLFLLTGRFFSPQFILVIFGCAAFSGALSMSRGWAQFALGGLLVIASAANAFVWPHAPPRYLVSWQPLSAIFFASAFSALGLILVRAWMPRDRNP